MTAWTSKNKATDWNQTITGLELTLQSFCARRETKLLIPSSGRFFFSFSSLLIPSGNVTEHLLPLLQSPDQTFEAFSFCKETLLGWGGSWPPPSVWSHLPLIFSSVFSFCNKTLVWVAFKSCRPWPTLPCPGLARPGRALLKKASLEDRNILCLHEVFPKLLHI